MTTGALNLAQFTALDWGVLVFYFVVVLSLGTVIGLVHRVRGSRDYFLAARAMPGWVVAISVLSTAQSAATFIGGPGQSYAGDLTYLSSNIGQVIAALILAWAFIPAYYRAGVTTPYELLESRFGPTGRVATSITYLVGRIFSSGSRVFIGALPMSLVVFGDTSPGHMAASIGIVTVVGTLYALLGGIRSVIWTDVLQVGVYMGSALLAIVFLCRHIEAPIGDVVRELARPVPGGGSKLTIFRTGFESGHYDFTQQYTLVTAFIGFTLMGLASYGMDQDLVQRLLTCRSARKGAWSVINGVLVGIPAVAVFLVIGLLLFVYYQRPELAGATHAPGGKEKIFLQYILDTMPSGITGLMMAGLFAAGMAPLTSMSSSFVGDVYKRFKPGESDEHYLRLGRWGVVGFGVLLGLFACACIGWYDSNRTTLIDFALGVMTFAYAGLLGVFFTAMFTRRGSPASCVAALLTGFVVIALTEPAVWRSLTLRLGQSDWGDLPLAFPWRLTLGAAVSTAVCLTGSPGRGGPPERLAASGTGE